jgi:hypothetical protein
MSRPSVLLMVAGAMAVLVALVVLWQSTRSESVTPAATSSDSERGAPAAPPGAGTAAAIAPASRAAPRSGAAATPGRRAPAGTNSEVVADEAPRPAVDDGQNLQFGSKQLHAQTRAVEPLVRECVDKAVIAGTHPTGTALLTYIVAKRGDKLVIDHTGFDEEKTTLQHPTLVECLHQTAKAMQFEGLPRDAQEIYAARRVVLEDGKITEYKHVTFSYLR